MIEKVRLYLPSNEGFKIFDQLGSIYLEEGNCEKALSLWEVAKDVSGGYKNISKKDKMTFSAKLGFCYKQLGWTDKLKVLQEVGLGYLQLGQSATTLSGGEAQRIKLARELTHTLGKKTLYLLDEPTVGLHYHDVELLLEVLNKLIDRGNSIAIIEHNMHVIKSCDYIIDLGPGGGDAGGKVVAKGTPEEIVSEWHKKKSQSETAKYLKDYLK